MKQSIEERLQIYSNLFDYYLEKGRLTEEMTNDPLANYLSEVLEEPANRHLCETDDVWRELFRTSLMDFFRQMLQYFEPIEQEEKEEKQYIDKFFQADLPTRRERWRDVCNHINKKYAPIEVNVKGYINQFVQAENSQESIFSALESDWQQACEKRGEQEKKKLLKQYAPKFQQWIKEAGQEDYQTICNTEDVICKYPLINEILRLIGREKEVHNEEVDTTISRYLPEHLSPNNARTEIEGIRMGDDLQALLPTEIALLSEPTTELLFYHRFTSKQLQQLSGRPKDIKQEKTELKQQRKPRLQKGPIIVSIDTSGSMMGMPEKVSKSLLLQILQVTKKEKRKCFLITYAVRSRTIEITRPEKWRAVKAFLKEQFTGGTNGEAMFRDALQTLRSKEFAMADVLIISDFEFPLPKESTQKALDKERTKGSHFYGLQIGNYSAKYEKIMDRMWQIRR